MDNINSKDTRKKEMENFSAKEEQIVQILRNNSLSEASLMNIMKGLYERKNWFGPDGLLSGLIKDLLQAALQGEMDSHLNENALENASNRRNGSIKKQVKTPHGTIEISTPRDRQSTFEPQIVKKRQVSLNDEIEGKILSLYGIGASYNDISEHLFEIYGLEVSNATISAVTDRLLPKINEWKSRPLDEIYTIIFMDAMFFKTKKDGRIGTKTMYNLMGIKQDGRKEILGAYFCESEGASFWLNVLNDLKNRGIKDILIACIDGLKGFPEAIQAAFPQTEVQLCIVHQIRNSLKLIGSKHQKEFMQDLKEVYKAPNLCVAEENLDNLENKWGEKYPIVIRSWRENWDNLMTYFKYSEHVRKLIYTTNPIEGFHRQVRKYTKTKGAFTSDDALLKLTFVAIMNIEKKWNQPIPNWAEIFSQLDIYFPGRLNFRG